MLNPLTQDLLDQLSGRLGPAAIKDPAAYLSEPRGRLHGRGKVLAPASTAEVAVVVQACAQARVGIVPYGGGTGLVGGQVMPDGPEPLILSLERLSAIRQALPSENVIVAEAGAILAHVHEAAEAIGRLFPLSLGSEGSARIGGLLSTNAGGVNVLRYGPARALCLGIEAVLPDGSVLNGLTRLRKDNTGYDLRDLMIGAEGTLGIITAAALRLFPRPATYGAAILAVPSPAAALDLLSLAGEQLGEVISAFELIHRQGMDFLAEVGPKVTPPLQDQPDWMVLIDIGLPAGPDATELLTDLYAAALGKGLVSDGVIAQSQSQRAALWSIRESIPIANKRIGSISSHDISLPLSQIAGFINRAESALKAIGTFRINCFGHLGDGNLHYNVFAPQGIPRDAHDADRALIQQTVHDITHELGGSFSAEHGVGRFKVKDLERYADPARLAAMRAIKTALDPEGIMNPGAVLRPH